MGGSSFPPNEPQYFNVRIQYDPEFDHFIVDGSFTFTRPILTVDGYDAYRKLKMYLDAFFHEVEAHKRSERTTSHKESSPPHCEASPDVQLL